MLKQLVETDQIISSVFHQGNVRVVLIRKSISQTVVVPDIRDSCIRGDSFFGGLATAQLLLSLTKALKHPSY